MSEEGGIRVGYNQEAEENNVHTFQSAVLGAHGLPQARVPYQAHILSVRLSVCPLPALKLRVLQSIKPTTCLSAACTEITSSAAYQAHNLSVRLYVCLSAACTEITSSAAYQAHNLSVRLYVCLSAACTEITSSAAYQAHNLSVCPLPALKLRVLQSIKPTTCLSICLSVRCLH
ncbi:hypothetical protein J6590_081609 [Homalodisca vitripennis]|nr:hypothetical protein J6590_081609 [Homalodisca vitripennis]